MRRAHAVEQVRSAEGEALAALPDGALMQRAAAGLAVAISDLLGGCYGRRVLLLVGSGDNGGDALYAGAMLARRGAQVEALLLSENVHAGGLAALRARAARVVTAETATLPDVVVDGIVGIGGRPGLRPDAESAVGLFPDARVVAVDVPSGVNVDTGELDGPHVVADLTVTFGTHKPCHLLDPAAQACGVVTLVGLELDLPDAPVEALQAADVAALLPRPDAAAHKYTRGVVGVSAGSTAYPGAAVLCASGASSGLAGMVRYVGPAAAEVVQQHPGIVVGSGRVQAWVVGPGSGDAAPEALATALEDRVPTVVDAAALRALGEGRPDLVLTPHAGELAGLLNIDREVVEGRQLEHARLAARRFGCVVVLKGRRTLIAHPDGRIRVTTSGVPWLAVAGAGDVLAGLIGSLLAAGLDPYDAASAGSWLHGAAAVYAGHGGPVTPEAVADAIAPVVRSLLG
ncbi:MAG TPA: NAD(P)H-hydrate dehydratase [Marmoricola sp.]|nr:NAD(P)H-hydrate dehydratase [Marmoricola sp.]